MTLKAELERTYRHSSFRFNFDNDDMLQWKHEMNEWQDELKHELNMDFEHRIRIEERPEKMYTENRRFRPPKPPRPPHAFSFAQAAPGLASGWPT